MTKAYLISVRRHAGEEGLKQLSAATAELMQAGIVPQRRDTAGKVVRWISVVLDDHRVESIRRRYPALLVGHDANLAI